MAVLSLFDLSHWSKVGIWSVIMVVSKLNHYELFLKRNASYRILMCWWLGDQWRVLQINFHIEYLLKDKQ